MEMIATRVKEGRDLKQSIIDFAANSSITAGTIICAVGSLSKAHIRMAGAQPNNQDVRAYEGIFEIVSLTGTISIDGEVHLHISFADKEGAVVGGHLKDGCIVHTTVELIIAKQDNVIFNRKPDPKTGFDELEVQTV